VDYYEDDVVHKDLLTFYSDYFRAAFNGSFKEATENKIALHDECEDVFEIFSQFIYSRRLSDEEDQGLSFELLKRVWLFGDKYVVPSLQNVIMNALAEKSAKENSVPTAEIKDIWAKTLRSSPLRKWVLDEVVSTMKVAEFRVLKNQWPREALFDLLEVYEGFKKSKGPKRGKCHFHIHKEGEKC